MSEQNIPNNLSIIIVPPLKDFKKAILTTLFPPMSEVNRMARQNSKGKRKCILAKTGEKTGITTKIKN